MTDSEQIWAFICEQLAQDDYGSVEQLLEQQILQQSAQQQTNQSNQTNQLFQLYLWAAHFHLLYGAEGADKCAEYLQKACNLSDDLQNCSSLERELWQALEADRKAQPNPSNSDQSAHHLASLNKAESQHKPTLEIKKLSAWNYLANYHWFCALQASEEFQKALDVAPPPDKLPMHLRWRSLAYKARCHEALGQISQALQLYEQAAELANGTHKAFVLQEQASTMLDIEGCDSETSEAVRKLLDQAQLYYLQAAVENPHVKFYYANWHFLYAQALIQLDQPEAALEDICQARILEQELGRLTERTVKTHAQILVQLGDLEGAQAVSSEALQLANNQEMPYFYHDMAMTLLEEDYLLEAREYLERLMQLPQEYPYQPEVLADWAECERRLGNTERAQELAQQSLEQGAALQARMVLGYIELDYYRLELALEHFEQLIREASPHSYDWALGHKLVVEIMAQQGFPDPATAYQHAKQALTCAHMAEEDYSLLHDYLEKLQHLLEHTKRTLN